MKHRSSGFSVSVTHYKEIITILTNSDVPDKKRPSVNLYFDVKVCEVVFKINETGFI